MANHILRSVVLFSVLAASLAVAGGGPENVAVVVNDDSEASRLIAEEYVRLRKIHPVNVIRLMGVASVEQVDVDTFRDDLLSPVLSEIEKRGLNPQIDCIAWSADFPWSINARGDFKGRRLSPTLSPIGSLNGMTYLHESVLAKKGQYLRMDNNWYMRRPLSRKSIFEVQPTRAFHASNYWNSRGEVVEKEGQRYLLSTMLAVTSGRGMSVDEAIASLRRSVAADATHPEGVFYFMVNGNVRSTTREPAFQSAVDGLKKLGMKAEIIEGRLPMEKTDVAGAMIGAATFDWAKSKSEMVPGAICEHLTSFGGVMRNQSSQTPCTEFIKFGAAGSSGTVTEPYAIQAKFPFAFLHLHYARGSSLAESFYQSVYAPYQLLIVGDPLCQPWAEPPKFTVQGVAENQAISGTIEIEPAAVEADSIQRFELFVDGVRQQSLPPGESFLLEAKGMTAGEHELRVVAIGASVVECQNRVIFSTRISNPQ